jgi:hypothetical protein
VHVQIFALIAWVVADVYVRVSKRQGLTGCGFAFLVAGRVLLAAACCAVLVWGVGGWLCAAAGSPLCLALRGSLRARVL